MEDNNANIEALEEELGDAPPILQSFNPAQAFDTKSQIKILKQDKKLKLDLIEKKEKEIEKLKKDIEEIDEEIKNQIIGQYKIIIETYEDIKNQEKVIKENISLLFKNYKDIEKKGEYDMDTFLTNNEEIIKNIFLVEDLNEFYYFIFEIVKDDSKFKKNIDNINKKQTIFQKRNIFFEKEIFEFFKGHKEEKEFTKILILFKMKCFETHDEIALELKRKNIMDSNIIEQNEYIHSSKENKILFLNNAIENCEYEIQELLKKAKESLKSGDRHKAKLFVKEKKFISLLLEKYKDELNALNSLK